MAKAIKKKRVPKVKSRKVRFYGLNVTLQSEQRKGTKTYLELVKKLYDDGIVADLGGEKKMVLRTQFSKKIKIGKKTVDILYGSLLRFTVIKSKKWYHQKQKIFQSYKLPRYIAPNAFETDYVFIPAAHRFFIRYNNKVNIYQAKTFMEKALKRLIVVDENIHVNIISSKDVIETILDAKAIVNLEIKVSYTNDDIDKDAKELIDNMLKSAQAGEAELHIRPDASGTLDSKSDMVSGFLGVAKENGSAKATILGENGKRKTIKTANYPEKIGIEVKDDEKQKEDEKEVLTKKIIDEYRNDE